MIELDNVSYRYLGGDSQTWALHDINLQLASTQFVAFLGQNGSGKSTLSRLLNGLELPSNGSVSIDGLSTDQSDQLTQIRRSVQVVFQNPDTQQVGLTLAEDIAFGLSNIGYPQSKMMNRVKWALGLVGLQHASDYFVHELSGGEKQKLALAAVLALSPTYLVLDEATSMLDPMARREFLHMLHQIRHKQPFALLYITHHLDEVLHADRWIFLHHGKIVADGHPNDLLQNEDLFIRCGLEIPYRIRLIHQLHKQGMDIPWATSIDQLVEWL
ncbi:energy-coupling factor transport system ATP-binding protein [Seinonella peptonophila]|uniref:Energy-coupling factor transport system ATP-binding protein n=1 Tax=Seinonella peptonophila TaxID=112248 RepID=A0A1M5BA00_9BACL|nr:ATP-binding cassette domain-containing protein [Seinonella peptonophila]SHF39343.1 energy-coupling factor transport system ATP-binding protein [Seinonella peptonophila]